MLLDVVLQDSDTGFERDGSEFRDDDILNPLFNKLL